MSMQASGYRCPLCGHEGTFAIIWMDNKGNLDLLCPNCDYEFEGE